MRSRTVLSVFVGLCAVLHLAHAQCDLSAKKIDKEFPDLEKMSKDFTYQMTVEYTLPGAKQTDYYTEFYDMDGKGRVDSHQAGKSMSYIYRTESLEAWEVTSDSCKLKNITDTPEMYRDLQTDWLYYPNGKTDKITVGPSAMFKIARDVWNSKDRSKMAYMGTFEGNIQGLEAEYWQRCYSDDSWVKYYFTADTDENAYNLKRLKIPILVEFDGVRSGVSSEAQQQDYNIMTFQPFISLGVKPFQLPKGGGCKRAEYVPDAPEIPNFAGKDLMFQAEVVYRTVNENGDATQYWSYYTTLFLAIDVASNHIAYYYAPWSNTKEPSEEAPKHVIFDSTHGYAYITDFDTGKCEISRQKVFVPEFLLPNGAGSIDLTDPSMLFQNNEFVFVTKGTNRGLKVNIFEENIENFLLRKGGSYDTIPKAFISHSYLQDDEVEQNTVSVKNALTQIQMVFEGRNDTKETLDFNFFGFTTELRDRRRIFNIKRCFKNDDDYVWVTIGFNADKEKIAKVQEDVPSIQQNVFYEIMARSELNAVRIPVIEVDIEDAIFVTLLILGKPPVMLDYTDAIDNQTITGATEVEGVSDFDTCATMCLESEGNCWGFSICGALCYFGTKDEQKPGPKTGCKLYNRYDKNQYIPSKEKMVAGIRAQVEGNQFSLVLKDKDNNMVQIDASSIEVSYPGEEDRIFNRIGNNLDPRMRVVKAGYKLKDGTPVKNMGRLRYEECQRLCIDYKECETISYCLTDGECVLTGAYGDDIKDTDMEANNMCNLITRKYADNFKQSPGVVLTVDARAVLDLDTVEKCAKACITNKDFECHSFDYCSEEPKGSCKLHTVHFPNDKTREPIQTRATNCGHYYRKISTEFNKNLEKRSVGSPIPPLYNMTLEECSKNCKEYNNGACTGFDFCQGATILSTSCTLLDSDPTKINLTYNPICTNYLKKQGDIVKPTVKPPITPEKLVARPYTSGYAGGIAVLCLVVGGLLGAGVVFGIVYYRMNRQQ